MNILKFMAKRLRRRQRVKGSLRKQMNRPGRNRQPITAVDLWQSVYRFKETPAKRAGTKRRIARERKMRRKGWSLF